MTPSQRHRDLDREWLEAVELDYLRDERRPHALLPFQLLRWLFSHLRQPWDAFDELPPAVRERTWAALRAEAKGERRR